MKNIKTTQNKIKIIILLMVISSATFLSAQGFYIDAGVGLGMSDTAYKPDMIESEFGLGFMNEVKMGFDTSIKAGYGPFSTLPMFFVGEFGITRGATWEEKYEARWNGGYEKGSITISGNHLFLGPGIVFYPVEKIQLAGSFGMVQSTLKFEYSDEYWESSFSEKYSFSASESGIGYGYNLSGAYDIGGQSGVLIGAKVSYAKANVIEFTDRYVEDGEIITDKFKFDTSNLFFGMFVKYRFKGM